MNPCLYFFNVLTGIPRSKRLGNILIFRISKFRLQYLYFTLKRSTMYAGTGFFRTKFLSMKHPSIDFDLFF